MDRVMTLNILGERDSEILRIQIDSLGNVCSYIEHALELRNESTCSFLSEQMLPRIEAIDNELKLIRELLDPRYSAGRLSWTNEAIEVRDYLITLRGEIENLRKAIGNRNTNLVGTYIMSLRRLLLEY